MPTIYTKEQLWKLFEKLPSELQEAIFSEENSEHIGTICERYGVKEEQVSEVAKYVGRVLIGLLPPEDFPSTLVKEVGIKNDTAKQIAHEINRFVFAPVKELLAQIYHIGAIPSDKVEVPPKEKPEESMPAPEEAVVPPPEEKIERGPDAYREPIE